MRTRTCYCPTTAFEQVNKIEIDNILTDALFRLNLPVFDEEAPSQKETIINSVGLKYESDIEIIEFHNMIEIYTQQEINPDKEHDPRVLRHSSIILRGSNREMPSFESLGQVGPVESDADLVEVDGCSKNITINRAQLRSKEQQNWNANLIMECKTTTEIIKEYSTKKSSLPPIFELSL